MNTTPPPDVRLKTYQTPKYQTRWTPFTHNTRAPVWIPVPAWRQLLRPITVGRSSLRPGPHRYLLLPRLERGSRRFLPCPPRLPVPVLVLPLLPWLKLRRRVPVPVKCKKLWQKRSTLQPQGPPGSSSRIANHYHTPSLSYPLSSGLVCSHSIATNVPLSPPLVITPPSAGLLCMALIIGGTLDTTPPYKSTPGDDIFKGQRVITGVCFHPCYTVA